MNGAEKIQPTQFIEATSLIAWSSLLMYKKKENILTLVIDKVYRKNIVLKAIYHNKQVHVTQYIQFLVAMKS